MSKGYILTLYFYFVSNMQAVWEKVHWIRNIFLYYSIKSDIFPSFAHVITGPKPCVNIVTRSCYSSVLPSMRNTYRAK
jgi:hypothetical protein